MSRIEDSCMGSVAGGVLLYSSSPMISQMLHRSFLRAPVIGNSLEKMMTVLGVLKNNPRVSYLALTL